MDSQTLVVEPTLERIADKWRTDKAAWWHDYCKDYDSLFTPIRHEPITLLELGYGVGRSALTWIEYFPNATIAVIDDKFRQYRPWPQIDVDKYQGDQTDPRVVDTVVERHGDFDIIIDDASHITAYTLNSFALLWPHLKPGGYYAIEDIDVQDLPRETWNRPDAEMVVDRKDLIVLRRIQQQTAFQRIKKLLGV